MPFCPGARFAPPAHSSKQPSTQSRIRCVARALRVQDRLVEDEVRVRAQAQVEDLRAEARDLDVGERDRVADDRVEVGRPVRQLAQLGDEAVVAVRGLLERRAIQLAVAGPPAAEAVARDRAALDLDDQEALVGVGDDDVRLALAHEAAVRPDDPRDVLEEDVVGGQGRAEALVDAALGALAEALPVAARGGRALIRPGHLHPGISSAGGS